MQALTKQKAKRVRRALLTLTDVQLVRIVEDWLTTALEAWPLNEADDEALFSLGYQLKVIETGEMYTSWELLDETEELDLEGIALIPPVDRNWREKLVKVALPTFYHTVLWAAGETLDQTAFADNWGPPPGPKRSGYAFLDKLADHLVLARKLSADDLHRFTYATQRLGILSHRGLEAEDALTKPVHHVPALYADIDAEIARLVREPELPYWLRSRHRALRRKSG